MKKGKLLVLALIAIMLAGGLSLASCGLGCRGTQPDGDYKGRCAYRVIGGRQSSVDCQDTCINDQMKKQGSPVDLNCNC